MSPVIDGKKTVFVSILRAGNGFLDGMLSVVPGARVGHVGLVPRPASTLGAIEYYFKMPHDMHERDAIVLDPMLATGNSAIAAVDRLKETAAQVDPHGVPAGRARGAEEASATRIPTCPSTPRRSTAS